MTINAQQNNKARIHILHADMSMYDEQYGGDVDWLVGDVVMRHDSTYFYSDKASFNDKTQYFGGFGNVHIKVNDSTDIYCDRCKYSGDTKLAELFDHVVLKDDSTVLKSHYMTYDREKHLAMYPNKGYIDRNDKHLISVKGYYRDDVETAFFKKDVYVITPKYKMYTDSLVYVINEEKMMFFGATRIISDDYVLDGNIGYYDGLNDVVYLHSGATITNKELSITSNIMFYERNVEFAKAIGNVVITDTTNKATIMGNYAELWKKLGKAFVTDSICAMYYGEEDTLFLHSDTLFTYMDTVNEKVERILAYNNVRFYRKDIQGKCDSLCFSVADSTARMRKSPFIWAEKSQLKGDSINIVLANSKIDSVLMYPNGFIIQQDSIEGFNQIKGKTITAYFKDNELDHVINDGNAETAYWLREEDGTLVGINMSQSPLMDIKIKDNQINRIKYLGKTTETLYPKEKLEKGREQLKGFEWQDALRPKDRHDIFREPVENKEEAVETSHRKKKK